LPDILHKLMLMNQEVLYKIFVTVQVSRQKAMGKKKGSQKERNG
jgi:hypothetical protein